MEDLRIPVETKPNDLLEFVHDDFGWVTIRWSRNYTLQLHSLMAFCQKYKRDFKGFFKKLSPLPTLFFKN